MMTRSPGSVWAAAFGLAVVAGCGAKSDLDLVPLRGQVTYQGQPLKNAQVVYVPDESSAGRQASGSTGDDGTFALTTVRRDDGVMRGAYRIAIFAYAPVADEPTTREEIEARAAAGKLHRGYVIPEKFTDPEKSGLTDVVDDSHSGFKQIDLAD